MLLDCEYKDYGIEVYMNKHGNICIDALDRDGRLYDVTKDVKMWLLPNQFVLNLDEYPNIDQALMECEVIKKSNIVDETQGEEAVYELTSRAYQLLERN